jgi:hypothetical protein
MEAFVCPSGEISSISTAENVRPGRAGAKLGVMSAHRIRRKDSDHSRHDDRSSGVFELPAGSRVARRGSTRVEPSTPAEHASRARGRALRHDA